MAKIAELRELGSEELEQKVRELDDQLFRLRLQKSMGQTDAAHKMQGLRVDRARARTLLREREMENVPAESTSATQPE
tara:strand:- start:98 stop:331 length:234 start_codon:yes stop_codon:yes gene_type:complete